ncbi:MAG: hypothetical protein KBT34_05565 [Prevotella sp.]|nr:hypothetical protein [Candidatus Prevotella equi]
MTTTIGLTTVLSIAIANNWCVVCDVMYQSQVQECATLATDNVEGCRAYRKNNTLYLVSEGREAFLESDKINDKFGEENVKIHDFGECGCIFEVKG